jgi:formylglycine-generating enzyme required for sulfatase activity
MYPLSRDGRHTGGVIRDGIADDRKGSRRQRRALHNVTIARPFAVSKFEQTFAEWNACIADGGCEQHEASDEGWGRGRQPVINITWNDAKSYAAWLSKVTGKSYRLLTEAEYEYAARSGTQTTYPWGDEIGKNNASCNGCGSQWDGINPAPVGSFAPNRFGLYDMVGNVWEWVEDCGRSDYAGATDDGSVPLTTGATSSVFESAGPLAVENANCPM